MRCYFSYLSLRERTVWASFSRFKIYPQEQLGLVKEEANREFEICQPSQRGESEAAEEEVETGWSALEAPGHLLC